MDSRLGGITTDLVAGVFIVAVIMVLVRPNSMASEFIRLFTSAMESMVKAVTDL